MSLMAPLHGPKVSKKVQNLVQSVQNGPQFWSKLSRMVHNFRHVFLVTIWNGIQLDHNVSKCIISNHIFQNYLREYAPTCS